MTRTRGPNTALRGCMAEAGWNGPALAAALQKVARESGFSVGYDRTTVAHWLSGTQPRPPGPQLLQEAFARRLARPVSRGELGLNPADQELAEAPEQETADALTGLRRLHAWPHANEPQDETFQPPLFQIRMLPAPRPPLRSGPGADSALRAPVAPTARRSGPERVGARHAEAVREMTAFGARHYDGYGGAVARSLLLGYLRDHVLPWAKSPANDQRHRELLVAASQLVRLVGRTYTDDNRHGEAQRHYRLAYQLATEAQDGPAQAMALRDQSTQAGALGHHAYAARLADGAAEHLPPDAAPGVRAFVLAQQAVAAARLRQAAEALKHLEAAQHWAGRSAVEGGPHRYPEPALLYQAAQVHRSLRATELSLSYLRASLRARPAGEHRTIGVSLLQLAHLELDSGNIHQARRAYTSFRERQDALRSPATTLQLTRLEGRFARLGG
ncbi:MULTISPECIES: hypothetical protein [Kitasatospora]|uniref:Regulatory protein n=1 Tax=Kitasatospora setae (strain ATCC 33774 / DSM 43861 / JCM 3304 / KCC A-0304 / NBRC 14216 / KM-6054) TaxID=452652 RepID=E4N0T5_KITSK|nr:MULTISPECIES: hypothetical protein [Kitasatospora]BAJ31769.1 hypothetical protein KSE_60000 [Kitasatospora setae KM-6054]